VAVLLRNGGWGRGKVEGGVGFLESLRKREIGVGWEEWTESKELKGGIL
jgi:hypothetical protein